MVRKIDDLIFNNAYRRWFKLCIALHRYLGYAFRQLEAKFSSTNIENIAMLQGLLLLNVDPVDLGAAARLVKQFNLSIASEHGEENERNIVQNFCVTNLAIFVNL
eukprot:TRINITY_DN12238_c2_g2_i1.p4 TRINITY_DN12238_c2_g2~~TRINITY_DN12238_c2_g2_i1.p4  ORF type:complete len:105 (+),score=13.27 TRINITY_DN12238_c2_g2_i1:1745-2059(+)